MIPCVHSFAWDFAAFFAASQLSSSCFWPIHQQHMHHSLYCEWQLPSCLENMLLSSIPLISPTDVKSFLVKQSIINCTTNQGGGGLWVKQGLGLLLMFDTFSVWQEYSIMLLSYFVTTLKTAHQRYPWQGLYQLTINMTMTWPDLTMTTFWPDQWSVTMALDESWDHSIYVLGKSVDSLQEHHHLGVDSKLQGFF